jgi:hypothetical protein
MAFRTATSRRAGAGILGMLAVLLAAALATGQPDPVLAAGGLPAVVRYGTPGFPETAKSWPANRGNLFAGGAGGTAKLVQQTSVTPNARCDIAGWLGGTKTSAAELTVQFTDTSGRILATAAIGPAGNQAKPVLDYRQAVGTVPAGATRARGDDHADDHPHRLEWPRHAADRI